MSGTFWSVAAHIQQRAGLANLLAFFFLWFYFSLHALNHSLNAQLFSLPYYHLRVASDFEHLLEACAILCTSLRVHLSFTVLRYFYWIACYFNQPETCRPWVGTGWPSQTNKDSWKSKTFDKPPCLPACLLFCVLNIGCGEEMCPPVSLENFCGSSFLCIHHHTATFFT